jgi:hypothetical protein
MPEGRGLFEVARGSECFRRTLFAGMRIPAGRPVTINTKKAA